MAIPTPFSVEAFPCEPAVHIFAQPIQEGLRSSFHAENEFASSLNRRGLHFIAGRLAAHAALRAAGATPAAILRGPNGEPLWPEGFVGSISHTRGMAVAAIGLSTDYAGLGIDIESRNRVMETRVQRLVCHPNELAWQDDKSIFPVQNIIALISAKEVIFKAYFPASQVRLGYQDAQLQPVEQGMEARITYPFAGAGFPSRLSIRGALIRDFWVMFGALPHLRAAPATG